METIQDLHGLVKNIVFGYLVSFIDTKISKLKLKLKIYYIKIYLFI
jgi:hypothetical protein